MYSCMNNCSCCSPCYCMHGGAHHHNSSNNVSNQTMSIMLIPSDNSGNISNDAMLSLRNKLNAMGADPSTMQSLTSTLSSVGSLTPINMAVCIGQGTCKGQWFAKVPENFQPENLTIPLFNNLQNPRGGLLGGL